MDATETLIEDGLELSRAGRHAEAVQRFHQAVTQKPDAHDAWVCLSDELHAIDDYPGAAAAADRALAIQPTCSAWISKAAALDGLGRYEESAAAIHQAIALEPANPYAHYCMGQALARQHNAQGALAAFDYALGLDSTLAPALAGKAAALMGLDRTQEARTAADRALAMDPGIAAVWQIKAVILAGTDRNFAAAEHAIDQAIAIEPNDADFVAWKGAIIADLGRHHEARQLWQRALQLDPQNEMARDMLGQSIQQRNERIAGTAMRTGSGCLGVLMDVTVAFVKAIFR